MIRLANEAGRRVGLEHEGSLRQLRLLTVCPRGVDGVRSSQAEIRGVARGTKAALGSFHGSHRALDLFRDVVLADRAAVALQTEVLYVESATPAKRVPAVEETSKAGVLGICLSHSEILEANGAVDVAPQLLDQLRQFLQGFLCS
jgi:hypothetical protein